jgi:hypothetical protein
MQYHRQMGRREKLLHPMPGHGKGPANDGKGNDKEFACLCHSPHGSYR